MPAKQPLTPLTSHPGHDASPPFRICERVISGGQAGVDRATLDWAMKHGYPHGGWCPRGRKAEDGIIPAHYRLTETDSAKYKSRTRRNVLDSDGTLILNMGALEGGTGETKRYAEQAGKPLLVIDLERPQEGNIMLFLRWLETSPMPALNIAGPRESKRPGIYRAALDFLDAVHAFLQDR